MSIGDPSKSMCMMSMVAIDLATVLHTLAVFVPGVPT